MKKLQNLILLICFGLLTAGLCAQDQINWLSFPEMESAVAKDPKPVIIDFYTSWCGWCKRMDKTTFSDKEVINYINENFYAVKFDAEHKETVNFRGRDFKFVANGRRGYNELAAGFLQGQMSYPSYVFLNEELDIITTVKGYHDKMRFMPVITYLGKGHYLDQEWEEFRKNWKGE